MTPSLSPPEVLAGGAYLPCGLRAAGITVPPVHVEPSGAALRETAAHAALSLGGRLRSSGVSQFSQTIGH